MMRCRNWSMPPAALLTRSRPLRRPRHLRRSRRPEASRHDRTKMAARILVADDSVTMRMIVQGALEQSGWTVFAAADGGAALDVAAREPVDLVVTDWNMSP